MSITFPQIGSTSDCAFWSCIPFSSKLYFGTYGYPKVYSHSPWTHLKDFGAGESIPRMDILNNKLYGITENKGYIYRMDNPTSWTVVHDDAYPYGLGMASLGSYIYGSFNQSGEHETKTLYSSNGTSWPQAELWNGGQLWVLMAYNGYVYELGQKESTGKTWARRGTTTSWSDVGALCNNTTGFWDVGLDFNNYLFLAMGRRSDGKVKIYRWNGSSLSGELFSITAFYAHYAWICDGQMYWLFGPFMNQSSSAAKNYYLYRTPTGDSGTWEHLHTFSANPISSHGKYRTRGCGGCLGNKTYIAVQNKVYRMDEEAPPSDYKFQVRNTTEEDWSAEYDDINEVPNARYIKITASFSRDSLIVEMPTLEDMTLRYGILSQPVIF